MNLSDAQILKKMKYLLDCNQEELGNKVGVSRTVISRVINGRAMRPKTRQLAEKILQQLEKDQVSEP